MKSYGIPWTFNDKLYTDNPGKSVGHFRYLNTVSKSYLPMNLGPTTNSLIHEVVGRSIKFETQDLHRFFGSSTHHEGNDNIQLVTMQAVLERLAAGEQDPQCPDCGGILKSATISFGQSLVAHDLARAEAAARDCDLLLAVGSTLSVYPVAGLVPIAKETGARIVIVNGEPTAMDDTADAVLVGDLNKLLPSVLNEDTQ